MERRLWIRTRRPCWFSWRWSERGRREPANAGCKHCLKDPLRSTLNVLDNIHHDLQDIDREKFALHVRLASLSTDVYAASIMNGTARQAKAMKVNEPDVIACNFGSGNDDNEKGEKGANFGAENAGGVFSSPSVGFPKFAGGVFPPFDAGALVFRGPFPTPDLGGLAFFPAFPSSINRCVFARAESNKIFLGQSHAGLLPALNGRVFFSPLPGHRHPERRGGLHGRSRAQV